MVGAHADETVFNGKAGALRLQNPEDVRITGAITQAGKTVGYARGSGGLLQRGHAAGTAAAGNEFIFHLRQRSEHRRLPALQRLFLSGITRRDGGADASGVEDRTYQATHQIGGGAARIENPGSVRTVDAQRTGQPQRGQLIRLSGTGPGSGSHPVVSCGADIGALANSVGRNPDTQRAARHRRLASSPSRKPGVRPASSASRLQVWAVVCSSESIAAWAC